MTPTNKEVAQMRQEYLSDNLEESLTPLEPFSLFNQWFTQAKHTHTEPNAMTLATCNAQGQPSARIVLLKAFDERGFVFFTNYTSHKGQQLEGQPKAALVFWWDQLERQLRIEGEVERVSAQESDTYFHSRPEGSRLGAWASPQSQVITGREVLENQVKAVTKRFEKEELTRPPHWGGYRIKPLMIEFWQGRSSRLHDRLRYQRDTLAATWTRSRLAP